MDVSILAGFQLPATPLFDKVDSAGGVAPTHCGGMALKLGTVGWMTLMVIVVVVAQEPAFGVNVYVPDVVLLTVAGDQVPLTAFVDVPGSNGAVVPAQKSAIWLNVGRICGSTVMV